MLQRDWVGERKWGLRRKRKEETGRFLNIRRDEDQDARSSPAFGWTFRPSKAHGQRSYHWMLLEDLHPQRHPEKSPSHG